jgi:hypothetical protein
MFCTYEHDQVHPSFSEWPSHVASVPFQPLWLNWFHVPFILVAWKAGFSLAMGDIFLAQ